MIQPQHPCVQQPRINPLLVIVARSCAESVLIAVLRLLAGLVLLAAGVGDDAIVGYIVTPFRVILLLQGGYPPSTVAVKSIILFSRNFRRPSSWYCRSTHSLG